MCSNQFFCVFCSDQMSSKKSEEEGETISNYDELTSSIMKIHEYLRGQTKLGVIPFENAKNLNKFILGLMDLSSRPALPTTVDDSSSSNSSSSSSGSTTTTHAPASRKRRKINNRRKKEFDSNLHSRCKHCPNFYCLKRNLKRHMDSFHSKEDSANESIHAEMREVLEVVDSDSSRSQEIVPFPTFTSKLRNECGKRFKRAKYTRPIFLSNYINSKFEEFLKSPIGGYKDTPEVQQTLLSCGRYMHFFREHQMESLNSSASTSSNLERSSAFSGHLTEQLFLSFMKEAVVDISLISAYIDELKQVGHFSASSLLNEIDRIKLFIEYLEIKHCKPIVDAHLKSDLQQVKVFLSKIRGKISKQKKKHLQSLTREMYEKNNEWATLKEMQNIVSHLHSQVLEEMKFQLSLVRKQDCQGTETNHHRLQFWKGYILSHWFLSSRPMRELSIKTMTVQDILIAMNSEEDVKTITFRQFKTSLKYGALTVRIHQETEELIRIWIALHNLRSSDICFTHPGKSFAYFWNRALNKHITITQFRKIVHTSAVEKLDASDVEKLCLGDSHSNSVARMHYLKLKSKDIQQEADRVYRTLF